MNFERAFEKLLGHEGGFVDHPKDPGGSTRYGITQRVARANGYEGDMRNFPLAEAKRIARKDSRRGPISGAAGRVASLTT